jgi:hypothetical protein
MRVLSPAELLDAWEHGLARRPEQRALALLGAACPEVPTDALARWSIGQRDGQLLTLREWTFGSRLSAVTTCPGCGEQLELTFDAADIRSTLPSAPSEGLSLSVDDYLVRFRVPNTLDVAVSVDDGDVAAIRQALLERCVGEARRGDESVAAADLPTSVIERVLAAMGEADPQADVELALQCTACKLEWLATFDIVAFFWSEIQSWAYRILHDVHVLASAYGWREEEILALSPWRREFYLEAVAG